MYQTRDDGGDKKNWTVWFVWISRWTHLSESLFRISMDIGCIPLTSRKLKIRSVDFIVGQGYQHHKYLSSFNNILERKTSSGGNGIDISVKTWSLYEVPMQKMAIWSSEWRIYTRFCWCGSVRIVQLQMATRIVSAWLPHTKMPVPVAKIPWISFSGILTGYVAPMKPLYGLCTSVDVDSLVYT